MLLSYKRTDSEYCSSPYTSTASGTLPPRNRWVPQNTQIRRQLAIIRLMHRWKKSTLAFLWKCIFWLSINDVTLLPNFRIQQTKIADFWLSKSIFYVKNYPNLFLLFFHWRISFQGPTFCYWLSWALQFCMYFFLKIMPLFHQLNLELW